jgi:hypothetical protein
MWPILHFYLQFKLLHTQPDGGSEGRTYAAHMKILHRCPTVLNCRFTETLKIIMKHAFRGQYVFSVRLRRSRDNSTEDCKRSAIVRRCPVALFYCATDLQFFCRVKTQDRITIAFDCHK